MNYIDFAQLGGMPFTQNRANFMQQSYLAAFGAFANLCGDKTILFGVVKTGSVVSDGWISYNGEMLPFIGGTHAADVVINTTSVPFTYANSTVHNVQFTKYATCGASGAFPFADLRRIEPLANIWQPGDVKQILCDAAYIAANFISGLGIGERLGWAIMDGANGTEDMGGFVSIGYKAAVAEYDEPGKTVGQDSFVVTNNNIQEAHIPLDTYVNDGSAGTSLPSFKGDTNNNNVPGSITSKLGVASPTPIDNRQKSKVLLYIQKL